MSTLIVHEWIAKHGGSENVLQCMTNAYPDADVFCLWNDALERFPEATVKESWIARTPLRKSKVFALPFMPGTWNSVDISSYNSILVSSHLFAHHIGRRKLRRKANMNVYVHTPARYIWTPELDSRGSGFVSRAVSTVLKRIDRSRAEDGARFAANSRFIQKRINDTWGQESKVIYPPVSIDLLRSQSSWSHALQPGEEEIRNTLPQEFVLGASRFVPYKNLMKVIEVGEALGLPVVLAGAGPDRELLAARGDASSVPVILVDRPSNQLLYSLYQSATLYVFPPVEDFGIMPVEAMALGTPALVNAVGGASESVELLNGGATFSEGSRSDLRRSAEQAMGKNMSYAQQAASMFSEQSFIQNIQDWVAEGARAQ